MTANLEQFRTETRAWLEANCPKEMRGPMTAEGDIPWGGRRFAWTPAQRQWLEVMAAKGWTVPTWPKEYGGGGLDGPQAKILTEEMRRLKARPPVQSFGIWMLGPALLKYGSHEQKLEHLPPIARGELRWCQGYSEPGAGSDLASIKTRADDHGDHWIVNGSKVWTSYADEADWIFCLVRTDPTATKHNGISFVLFDMTTPGVSTKPIKLISGYSPFCETFFDDVKVLKANLVGTLNRGWDIAKYLLTHEREMIGGMDMGGGGPQLGQLAGKLIGSDKDGRVDDPLLRGDLVRADIDGLAFMLTMERVKDEAKAGQGVGALSSMLKYYGTELNKRRQELYMSVRGSDGLQWESEASRNGAQARTWLRSRANSIEGGTSEVQLNIIAKRVLELPGA